jgi:alpha-tubulin suppressor-like RCC1 family protein
MRVLFLCHLLFPRTHFLYTIELHDLEGKMMWIFVTLGVLVVSGVGTYFYMQDSETYDVISDFKEIKAALRTFRNVNKGLTKGIENLGQFLPDGSAVKLDRYTMSIDDKFLIVNKIPKGQTPDAIIKAVGGKSKYVDNKLKLSFFTLGTGVEPQAVIRIKPMSNITTTTRIEYSSEESTAEDGKILKVEWEDNQEYFSEEGVHTIRLKVMDKHYRWSEWASIDIFVNENTGVKSIHASGGHVMITHNNGKVEAYGDNSFGQLGNCTNQNNVKVEELVQLERVESIACGDNHTVFLKSDKRVFAAGKNDFGQLGIGNRNNSKIPKLTWGIENIIQVSCGNSFSAALTVEGHVYTWGQNEAGCLGYGTAHFVDRPSRVEGIENIKSISVGQNYVMALGYDGNVFAWGENNFGQLALGFKSKNNDPVITVLKDIKQLAAGRGFTLAVTNKNRIMAVGLNKGCQLGYEGEKMVLFPQEISGLKDIDKVVTCGDFVLALDQTGNVYSWGQFSPADNDYSLSPYISDELKYVKDIAATVNHGYALLEDGTVYEFSSKFSSLRKLDFAKVKEINED